LDEAKKRIEQNIVDLKTNSDEVKNQMSDLKSHLYGKFGSHINLEADEE
jgi:prefoldin subunit 4